MTMTAAAEATEKQERTGTISEYRCPVCNKKLIVGTFTDGWAQAHCERCKRERQFAPKRKK